MGRKKSLKLLLIGLIAALLLAACGGGAGEAEVVEEEVGEEAHADEEMAGDDMMAGHTQSHVNVEDQDASSGTVVIGDIYSFEGNGWIVIHTDADGGPGPIAGYAPVVEGQNDNVEVEIDLSVATSTLYAMLHTDAGVAGEYEFPGEDGPVKDAEGNVITPSFEVTLPDAAETSDGEAAVTIKDGSFQAATLEVAAGTTVVWTHAGSLPHTVTSDDGLFDSGSMREGATFSFTFDEPGTYAYYCDFHGGAGGEGMSGSIVVSG